MSEADLGDTRLNRRLLTLLEQLAAQPTASLPQACGSWAATKAAYRFIASEKVTPQSIRDAHHLSVRRRLAPDEMILAIQDTTPLDLHSQPQMAGLGPIDFANTQGVFVHSLLLASPQGVPHGLLWQKVWARDKEQTGKSKQWRKRPLEDKESYKWLETLQKLEWALPHTLPCLLIGDREADMYPLFAAPRREKTHLLVRAAYDRRVREQAHTLQQALRKAPLSGTRTLTLWRRPGQGAREALLEVRFSRVTLLAPDYYQGNYPPVCLTAIQAREVHAPAGVTPLHWILLTSLPIADFTAACACLDWYAYRWLIEQYHHILKSGCRIEALQLETSERLQVALALYCIVAWRLLWLTYQARQTPEVACTQVLETHEWQALYCTIQRTPQPPLQPPSLREAVRWIAQLGGFLARKGDGDPGVQTLWRGMQRLHDIAEAWKLAQASNTYG